MEQDARLPHGSHFNANGLILKRLKEVLAGKRKVSETAKNHLALLAGFQSWKDLEATLHGETDASVNYD